MIGLLFFLAITFSGLADSLTALCLLFITVFLSFTAVCLVFSTDCLPFVFVGSSLAALFVVLFFIFSFFLNV